MRLFLYWGLGIVLRNCYKWKLAEMPLKHVFNIVTRFNVMWVNMLLMAVLWHDAEDYLTASATGPGSRFPARALNLMRYNYVWHSLRTWQSLSCMFVKCEQKWSHVNKSCPHAVSEWFARVWDFVLVCVCLQKSFNSHNVKRGNALPSLTRPNFALNVKGHTSDNTHSSWPHKQHVLNKIPHGHRPTALLRFVKCPCPAYEDVIFYPDAGSRSYLTEGKLDLNLSREI